MPVDGEAGVRGGGRPLVRAAVLGLVFLGSFRAYRRRDSARPVTSGLERAPGPDPVQVVHPDPDPVGRTGLLRTRVAFAVAAFALCAALPWAVPALPDLLGSAVPGAPSVAPAVPVSGAFVGPLGNLTEPDRAPNRGIDLAGIPRGLAVPRLGITSPVIPVSGQSGELVPPDDPQLLGWWREGAVAGATAGSAVVIGHTVHSGGGAFDHLGALVAGDRLRVRTQAGWLDYVVRRTAVLSTADLARQSGAIFDRSGPGRLVLITCDDWDGERYRSNAVVYAAPEPPASGTVRQVLVPDAGPG